MEQVTLRDWLAAQFMQARAGETGLHQGSDNERATHAADLARRCYRIADVMLDVRSASCDLSRTGFQ
jgi:hypothetical protein